MAGDVFNKYRRHVARHGVIKSLMVGITAGFFALLVTEIIVFVLDAANLFWIGFISFGVFAIAVTPLVYFRRYRPDVKTVAARLDELGSEERFITMAELDGVDTVVAKKQKSDATSYSESIGVSAIKFVVPVALIVVLAISFVLGAGTAVYTGLADAGIAPDINGIVEGFDDLIHEDVYYTVVYDEYDLEDTIDGYAVGDGYVVGETVQIVKEGEDCLTVYAEAIEGSAFYMWSDGVEDIMRTDKNIVGDLEIYAIFVEVDESDGDEGDGDGEGEEGEGEGEGSGDGDSSAMGEETAAGDGDGSGDGSDGMSDEGEGSGDDDSQGVGGGAGSGTHGNTNVKDNETDYRDEIDGAVEDASDKVNGNGNYSDDEKSIVDDYFDGLH